MPVWIRNYVKVLIAACLVVSFCLVEGDAQTRRKKRARRSTPAAPKPVITNPTIAPPKMSHAELIRNRFFEENILPPRCINPKPGIVCSAAGWHSPFPTH